MCFFCLAKGKHHDGIFLNTQPNKYPWHHPKILGLLGTCPRIFRPWPMGRIQQHSPMTHVNSLFFHGFFSRGAHWPGEQLEDLRNCLPQKVANPNQSCTSVPQQTRDPIKTTCPPPPVAGKNWVYFAFCPKLLFQARC